MSVENIIEKVSQEVQVLEEKLESALPKDVTYLTKVLTKIIRNLLILSNTETYNKIVKEYNQLMKEGNVIKANELLVSALERPVRYAIIVEKSKQAKKNLEKAIVDAVKSKLKKVNVDKEIIDKALSMIEDEEQPLIKICSAIDEAYINALRDLIANYVRITPYWQKYFTNIPALTDYRVGYLITIAPPWRFGKFSAYRLYIGTAPKKVYQILNKQYSRKAKLLFYVTFMLALRPNNPYYKKIFSLRFDTNKMKILDEASQFKYGKSINQLSKQEFEELLKWYEYSEDNEAKMFRIKTFYYAWKESTDIFAHHFWYITRKALGLPVQKPYPIEHLKHEPYYKPSIAIPITELVKKGYKPPAVISKTRKSGELVFVDVDTGELIYI